MLQHSKKNIHLSREYYRQKKKSLKVYNEIKVICKEIKLNDYTNIYTYDKVTTIRITEFSHF